MQAIIPAWHPILLNGRKINSGEVFAIVTDPISRMVFCMAAFGGLAVLLLIKRGLDSVVSG